MNVFQQRKQFARRRRTFARHHEITNLLHQAGGFGVIHACAQSGIDRLYAAPPGMLAENETVFAPDQPRIEALIVVRMLDQAIDVDARLMRERAFSDDAFLPGNRATRGVRHGSGELREALEINVAFNTVALTQTEHDFLQRAIAGAFSEPIDRRGPMRGTGPNGSQRVGCGHSKIIVGMHFNLEVGLAT